MYNYEDEYALLSPTIIPASALSFWHAVFLSRMTAYSSILGI